jgi:REP element-mobilizing transposase RayT
MSYWRLFYHITWATKHRVALILPEFEPELYPVMIAKTQSCGARVYALGGTENHVHLVASIPPDLPLSSLVGQVKGNSSHFINQILRPEFDFVWQREFGVVSFGGKQLALVVEYVRNQKAHHAENRLYSALEKAEATDQDRNSPRTQEKPNSDG